MATLPTIGGRRMIKRTRSVCPVCRAAVDADVVDVDGRVLIEKTCATHGAFSALLSSDARFYHESHGAREATAAPAGALLNVMGCGAGCGCHSIAPHTVSADSSAVRDSASLPAARDPFEALS